MSVSNFNGDRTSWKKSLCWSQKVLIVLKQASLSDPQRMNPTDFVVLLSFWYLLFKFFMNPVQLLDIDKTHWLKHLSIHGLWMIFLITSVAFPWMPHLWFWWLYSCRMPVTFGKHIDVLSGWSGVTLVWLKLVQYFGSSPNACKINDIYLNLSRTLC